MALAVSVDAFKEYMKVDYDDEDETIEGLLTQAQDAAEAFIYLKLDTFEELPASIATAIKLYASYFFEERGADSSKYKNMRAAFENLLYPFRETDTLFGLDPVPLLDGD